jgi:hypothetical protein
MCASPPLCTNHVHPHCVACCKAGSSAAGDYAISTVLPAAAARRGCVSHRCTHIHSSGQSFGRCCAENGYVGHNWGSIECGCEWMRMDNCLLLFLARCCQCFQEIAKMYGVRCTHQMGRHVSWHAAAHLCMQHPLVGQKPCCGVLHRVLCLCIVGYSPAVLHQSLRWWQLQPWVITALVYTLLGFLLGS